ncbi:glycosyltransferase family 9 protein [Flavobacteriaceae bacterium]|nr:glycosyltransferase family 9 protein [Flavobacteriaceae bacterium]MDC0554142.1 glycosyltransferase family 9 protein [Flavobacteriaceae bacterium]
MTHLLILRFSSMGDVAMMIPSLRCLTKDYPDLNITIVTNGFYKPFFTEFKNINFFATDFKNSHKGLKGLFKLYKELKSLKPTHIADLHSVIRTHFLSFLFKLRFIKIKKINKLRSDKKRLFRKSNKVLKPLIPTQYRYSEVFCRLGFNIDLTSHEFPLPKIITEKTQNFLSELEIGKKKIGIAPFASFTGKIYPLDLMQKVVAFLQNEHYVFLFGNGKYETDILKIWTKAYPNVLGCYVLNSLSSELEIISNLCAMISMDSANGHLAANYNVPVISLWGLTHPFAGYAPFLSKPENELKSDREKYPLLPTSAYGNKTPKGYENVMRTIDVNDVILAVNKVS